MGDAHLPRGDCGSAGHRGCLGAYFCVKCGDWRPLGTIPMPCARSLVLLSLGDPPTHTHTQHEGTDWLFLPRLEAACGQDVWGPVTGGGGAGVHAPQGGGDSVPDVPGPTWTRRGAEATVPPPRPAGGPAWPGPSQDIASLGPGLGPDEARAPWSALTRNCCKECQKPHEITAFNTHTEHFTQLTTQRGARRSHPVLCLCCPSCPRPSVRPSIRVLLAVLLVAVLLFIFPHGLEDPPVCPEGGGTGTFIGGRVYWEVLFAGPWGTEVPVVAAPLPPGGPSHWPPPGSPSFPAFPTSLPDWAPAVASLVPSPPSGRMDAGTERKGLSLPRPVEPRPTNPRVFLENQVGI